MIDGSRPLMTYEEAADWLRVTSRTVRQLVRDDKLRVVRFGGSVRIDPSDLRSFIRNTKTEGDNDAD